MDKEKLIYEIDNVTIDSLICSLNKELINSNEQQRKIISNKINAYQYFKKGEEILTVVAHQHGFNTLEDFANMGKITSDNYDFNIASCINHEIDKIMDKAKRLEPLITEDIKTLEDDNSFLFGLDNKLKSYSRIEEKLIGKAIELANNKNISIDDVVNAASDVCDSLRYTIITSIDKYKETIIKSLNKLEKLDYELIKFKNTWSKDSRYKGVNCNLKKQINEENIIIELQFHTPESYKVKGHMTHDVYEIMANDTINSTYTKLANDIQFRISSEIDIPTGIENFDYDNYKN